MAAEEGYIKFNYQLEPGAPAPAAVASCLDAARHELFRAGLIGAYRSGSLAGVGFGNVSLRESDGSFWISASATGVQEHLRADQFVRVREVSLAQNRCNAEGSLPPSSESMTHAAIYRAHPGIAAVLHAHNLEAWERLCGNVPTTDPAVAYGTPAMAREMMRLFKEENLPATGLLAMGGHREGLVAYGPGLAEALEGYRQQGLL